VGGAFGEDGALGELDGPAFDDEATEHDVAAVGPAALAAELGDEGLPWASDADVAPGSAAAGGVAADRQPPDNPPTTSSGMLRAAPPRPPSAPGAANPAPRTPPPRPRGRAPVPPPNPLRRELVESGAATPPTAARRASADRLQGATPAPAVARANTTPVDDLEPLDPTVAPDTTKRTNKPRGSGTSWPSRPHFTTAGHSTRPKTSGPSGSAPPAPGLTGGGGVAGSVPVDNPEDAQPTVAVEAPLSANLVETLRGDEFDEAPAAAPSRGGESRGFDPHALDDHTETPSAIAEYKTPPKVETYDTGKHRSPPAASCWKCGARVHADDRFCGTCGAADPGQPPPAASAEGGETVLRLAVIDDMGNEADVFELSGGRHVVGRDEACAIAFADDPLLAAKHAALLTAPARTTLQPIDEFNGTYLRIASPIELEHGDVLRIGQEVLRFERFDRLTAEHSLVDGAPIHVGAPVPAGIWGRLCQLGLSRQVCNAYLLSSQDVFLGRERGDILFPRDGFVSGSHAVISERNGRVYLKDLGSSNGTFVRVKSDVSLQEGDLLLLGRNLLRVKMGTA
jgi:pSer/pThr/pTyr-binding forkhead associated (FHA) protein